MSVGSAVFLLYHYIAGPVIGLIGCKYDWCSRIPKVTITQFMVGYVFATVGYPFCMGLTGALFSKVLGPIPQVSMRENMAFRGC